MDQTQMKMPSNSTGVGQSTADMGFSLVTWPSPGRRIQDTWQGDGPVDESLDDVTWGE